MYKLFLTCRYLLRKKIAFFAILSVWLCVAMVLIVFSVMDGFLENIKQHSRGVLSDIVLDNETLQGFPYYDEFRDHLMKAMPGTVELVTPVIYNYGILRVSDTNFTKPVRVVAVKLDDYCRINDFYGSLYYEKYYPGTTSLGPGRLPYAGMTADEKFVLPEDYELAFRKYLAEHGPDATLKPTTSSPHGVGRFEQLFGEPGYEGSELPGVIIGTDLVYRRKPDGSYDRVLNRGCEMILTILPLTIRGGIGEDPIPVALRHVDDSRTRVYEIDSMCVYTDFAETQRLLSMGMVERTDGTFAKPRTSQLLVRLKAGHDENEARARVEDEWNRFALQLAFGIDAKGYEALSDQERTGLLMHLRRGMAEKLEFEEAILLGGVAVETWQERQRHFIDAVEKEKVLVTLLFVIISVVAVVLIGVIFHMIVLQKTRDIGIIKSLGATREGVAGVFLMYGAAVGIIGGILGVVSGMIFVSHINEIQDMLAQLNPRLRVWSPDVYTFDRIPNEVDNLVALVVFLMAVVTSTLGSLVPALKAALVWPVEALRYE